LILSTGIIGQAFLIVRLIIEAFTILHPADVYLAFRIFGTLLFTTACLAVRIPSPIKTAAIGHDYIIPPPGYIYMNFLLIFIQLPLASSHEIALYIPRVLFVTSLGAGRPWRTPFFPI